MQGLRILTLRYWSVVGGVVFPMLPVAIYNYFYVRALQEPSALAVSPWYPVLIVLALGLPPLLLVGTVLAYVLPRPKSNLGRFAVGLAVGTAIMVGFIVPRI